MCLVAWGAMGREFTLESPFVEYTFNHVPDHWRAILAAWMLFWGLVVIALGYVYVAVLPSVIGFRATLLIGVFLVFMGNA